MEQPVKPAPVPVVQYDIAALQVKVMSLIVLVGDLEKTVAQQADQIMRLEERVAWNLK